ncbi:LYR motif-containing protein 5 [Linnemannia zychae]|nr:LYR motif-containing protein 5 [Linnemannia zychae]
MSTPTRYRVIALYKQLVYLGREYPAGADYFHKKLKNAFMKNKDLSDPVEIQKRIDLGDYVCKEIEAMYHINKYRAMKKRYYEDHEGENIQHKLENTNWTESSSSNTAARTQ